MIKSSDKISLLLLPCVLCDCYASLLFNSHFARVTTSGAFIDKTNLIKTFLTPDDSNNTYVLITCPPQFGKTVNLDMVRQFVEYQENGETADEIRNLFTDSKLNLDISKDKLFFEYHFGNYIVIYLDFFVDDDVKTYDEILNVIEVQMRKVFTQYSCLFNQSKDTYTVYADHKALFSKIVYGEPTQQELISSLSVLSRCILAYYGKRIVLLVDDFDAPVRRAIEHDANAKAIIKICRSLLAQAFRTKRKLISYAMLTGISAMVGDVLYSGTEHMKRFKFTTQHEYLKYYGFTEEEMKVIYSRKRFLISQDNMNELQQFCNGYQMQNRKINLFNPSWVVDYLVGRKLEHQWPLIGYMSKLQYGLKDTYLRQTIENACSQKKVSFKYENELTINDTETLEKMFLTTDGMILHTNLYLSLLLEMGYFSYWPTARSTWFKPILTSFCIPNDHIRLQLAYDFYRFFTGMIEEGEQKFDSIFQLLKQIIEDESANTSLDKQHELATVVQSTINPLFRKNITEYERLTEDYRFLLYSAAVYGSLYSRNQTKRLQKFNFVECASPIDYSEKPLFDAGAGRVDVGIVGNNGTTMLLIEIKDQTALYESLKDVVARVQNFRPNLDYFPQPPNVVKFLALFVNENHQVQIASAPAIQYTGHGRWMVINDAESFFS